jgi:hypothetical protein
MFAPKPGHDCERCGRSCVRLNCGRYWSPTLLIDDQAGVQRGGFKCLPGGGALALKILFFLAGSYALIIVRPGYAL